MEELSFVVANYDVQLSRLLVNEAWAMIWCYGDGGEQLRLFFVNPDLPPPNNYYNASKNVGSIFLPANQFSWYIDLLRNERPIQAVIYPDKPELNKLMTFAEPVGEAE